MASSLFVKSTWGLGDSIYARPFIGHAALKRDIYLETPWPEIHIDQSVRFVRGYKGLRVQLRNLARVRREMWYEPPPGVSEVALGYGPLELEKAGANVATAIAARLPPMKFDPVWDLPDMGKCPFDTGGAPLAIIRPVMRRHEWDNEARNPLPEYICEIAGDLKRRGFAVVVIADIKHGHEWLVGPMPPHNVALTRGELSVTQLLAAVRDAAIVVGGVGWIVPAAAALGTPAYIVLGGNGGMNAPDKLLDPRMHTERIGFAYPERFCKCMDLHHQCDKRIPDLSAQWSGWNRRVRLASPGSSRRSRTTA